PFAPRSGELACRVRLVLVSARPLDALPGLEVDRIEPDQPARLVERRHHVLRSVWSEVAGGHALCDGDPFATEIRLFDDNRAAVGDDLAQPAVLVDGERAALIRRQVFGPLGSLARDHPER